MKVILLKQISKLGKIGDIVEVSDGYAANSLFPNKSAIPASDKNVEALKRNKQSAKDAKALQHGLLEQAILALPNTTLEIKMKANEKGHLFSRVDEQIIIESLLQHRISISTKNVILDKNIKEIGSYNVKIKEGDFSTNITVVISS